MAEITLEDYNLSIKNDKGLAEAQFKAILRDKVLLIQCRYSQESGGYTEWFDFLTRLFNSYQFISTATNLYNYMPLSSVKLQAQKRPSPIGAPLELPLSIQNQIINSSKVFSQYSLVFERGSQKKGVEEVSLFNAMKHEANNRSGVHLGSDGSGYFAKGAIEWDAQGNLVTRGTFESNVNDNRIIIDPHDRSLKMLNSKDQVLSKQDFFINGNYSGGRLRINLVDQSTGKNRCYAEVDGGNIAVYTADRYEFFRADATTKKIWIDANLLPQSRDEAYPKEMYMDGETVKIRRGV